MNRTIATVGIDPATGLLFLPDYAGFLHCLDARTGKHCWTHDLNASIWGSPLICDGRVYQGGEDGLLHILAASRTDTLIAEHDMGGPVYSTPVFANGVLYVMTRKKLFAIPQEPTGRTTGPATEPR